MAGTTRQDTALMGCPIYTLHNNTSKLKHQAVNEAYNIQQITNSKNKGMGN